MKKFLIQAILLIIVTAGVLPFAFNKEFGELFKFDQGGEIGAQKLKIKDQTIDAEVADEKQERARGLSGRDTLSPNAGMLFVFDKPGIYKFWMKGMKFPLDIIYIRDKKVLGFIEEVPPPVPNQQDSQLPTYEPGAEVDSILEVNAGFIAKYQIQAGDSVQLVNQ